MKYMKSESAGTSRTCLHFPKPPPLGTIIERPSGQEYDLIDAEPYVRASDGANSFLLVWQTECPESRVRFQVKTGLHFQINSLRTYAEGVWDKKHNRVDKRAAAELFAKHNRQPDALALLASRVQDAYDAGLPVCFSGRNGVWERRERIGPPFAEMGRLKLQKLTQEAIDKSLLRREGGDTPWLVFA